MSIAKSEEIVHIDVPQQTYVRWHRSAYLHRARIDQQTPTNMGALEGVYVPDMIAHLQTVEPQTGRRTLCSTHELRHVCMYLSETHVHTVHRV